MKFAIEKSEKNEVPILSWCEDVEEGAMEQAYNLANHPAIKHPVALMPDCLTEDTEILTENGFIFIKDLSKDIKIANVYMQNDSFPQAKFEYPIDIINRPLRKDEFIEEYYIFAKNKTIKVTNNHRMAYLPELGVTSKNIPINTQFKDFVWGCDGFVDNIDECNLSDEEICLLAWIVGDGNIKKTKQKNGYISYNLRWGFTKERKIERVKNILNCLQLKYTVHEYERKSEKMQRQTAITLSVEDSKKYIELVTLEKQYPIRLLTQFSKRQGILFLDEALKVDGNWTNHIKYNSYVYNTQSKKDADFFAALISLHLGSVGVALKDNKLYIIRAIPNVDCYENNNGQSLSKIIKTENKNYKKNVVCVTCNSSYFIARQNGIVFVSGNCHQGYGMPIGGVIAVTNAIIINAIGVDIGCGMAAVRTTLKHEDVSTEQLEELLGLLKQRVPVGFTVHQKVQEWLNLDEFFQFTSPGWYSETVADRAKKSLGTLGGGNHFCSVEKDEDNNIWLMLHSGSRNLGKIIADFYHKKAIELNEKYYSLLPDKDLAFLPSDSQEGKDYIRDMNFALDFALENRKRMMEAFKISITDIFKDVEFVEEINIHHNYAALENHLGKNLWIHRKGATSAKLGEIGIIPGSMGTSSYIVEGLGNKLSYASCSHGAGRKMSRTQASDTLTEEECNKTMENVVFGGWGKVGRGKLKGSADLSESPLAYKDIDEVLESEKDLVKIRVKLTPIANMKG